MSKTQAGRVSAILLITPRQRPPESVVSGSVLHGLPVAIVQADKPSELIAWLRACGKKSFRAKAKKAGDWALLAEWESRYLRLAGRFARQLKLGKHRTVHRWPADRLNRADLLEKLKLGSDKVVYFGHGQSEGLVGYHGFWKEHLAKLKGCPPVGAWMSFSCSTLAMPGRSIPFGSEMVLQGNAVSYFGSVEEILTRNNAELSKLAAEVLLKEKPATLGAWLTQMDHSLQGRPEAPVAGCWRTYRLMGNPLQQI